MRTLVAGLGNIFAGDDGFGVEVVHRLQAKRWPPDVEVADFGIRGVHLAYQMLEGYQLVVIVDAVDRSEPPGTVFVIEHRPGDPDAVPPDPGGTSAGAAAPMDAHDLGPDGVLALVPLLGGTLGRVVIVGCQPADVGPRMGLHPVVAASVPAAARLVGDLLREADAPSGSRSGSTSGSQSKEEV